MVCQRIKSSTIVVTTERLNHARQNIIQIQIQQEISFMPLVLNNLILIIFVCRLKENLGKGSSNNIIKIRIGRGIRHKTKLRVK